MAEERIVRAAAVQISPDLDRPEGTLARVFAAIDEACAKGARFVVFPETLCRTTAPPSPSPANG